LKPHKFPEFKGTYKTPMPPPKMVKRLERIRAKGVEVEYPPAPWFTDNKEALDEEATERQRRMDEAPFAHLLPNFPAKRTPGMSTGKPRAQKKPLF